MDHAFSETQMLLRQTALNFFSRDYPLERMREIRGAEPRYSADLWQAIIDLGWGAAPFDEDVGGFAGSLLDAAVLIEQMGRAAAVTPFVHSIVAAGLALASCDRELAASVVAGEAVVIPVAGVTSRRGEAMVVESRGGEEAAVTGVATGVPWLPLATHLLVHTGSFEGTLLSADASSVAVRDVARTSSEPLAAVSFDGATGRTLRWEAATADPFLLGAAGQAIGLAGMSSRALELAVAYANERVQFGRLIGSFQAIQHKCADMHIAGQTAAYLGYKAAWAHGQAGSVFERCARHAKAFAGDAASFVTRQAIQVHGGVGFVDNHPAQLFYLGAMAAASTFGTAQEHRQALADLLLARKSA